MSEQDPTTTSTSWNERSLEWICCNAKMIRDIAEKLGVPAEAIAGAMVRENHYYLEKWNVHWSSDVYAAQMRGWTHERIYEDYLQSADIYSPRWEQKWDHPTLIDAGPGNFQIGTAIRLLENYMADNPQDPLNLSRYHEDYRQLVWTLTGLLPPQLGSRCGDETTELTIALYGLLIKEGLDFFNATADQTYWSTRSPFVGFRIEWTEKG